MPDTVSDDMVERVARALHKHDTRMHGGTLWNDEHWEDRREFRSAARAAISAMREPTEEMVKAGVKHALKDSLGWEACSPDDIREQHHAMIDAALSEPTEVANGIR